jgi:hypothetical protein
LQQWRGEQYVPECTDASLRWSANDHLHLPVLRQAKGSFVPAKESKPVRKGSSGSPPEAHPSKRQKTGMSLPQSGPVFDEDGPVGLEWDGEDYSCAYDILFTTLYDIWTRRLRGIDNEFMTALTKGSKHFENKRTSLEDIRDGIRSLLYVHSLNHFRWCQVGASVGDLELTMFTPENSVSSSQIRCTNCDYEESEVDGNTNYAVSAQKAAASMSKWIAGLGHEVRDPCPEYMSPMTCDIFFKDTPSILSLEYPNQHMRTSHRIVFDTEDGHVPLYLRGIIYLGRFHFTACIIHSDGSVWYHDGRKGHLL